LEKSVDYRIYCTKVGLTDPGLPSDSEVMNHKLFLQTLYKKSMVLLLVGL